MSEFLELFGDWATDSIVVETYKGTGFDGAVYLPAETVENIMVEDVRRLVRSTDGNELVSETTIYAEPEAAGKLTDGSRVTLPSGRRSKVLRVAVLDVFGLTGHVVVNLE